MDVGVFQVEIVRLDKFQFANHFVEQRLTSALHLHTDAFVTFINQARVDNGVANATVLRAGNEPETGYAAVISWNSIRSETELQRTAKAIMNTITAAVSAWSIARPGVYKSGLLVHCMDCMETTETVTKAAACSLSGL